MVKALHRAGIEVILDVVYNHTAEGNHLGPDAVASRASTTPSYYRLDARRPAPLHGLHGHRQHAQPGAPARAAADHGLAALLGDRDATSTASASTSPRRSRASSTTSTGSRRSSTSSTRTRCSRQVKLIAEPWDVGPGGYQVGQLPGRCGRSGTACTATRCATSGAGTAAVGEFARALHGLERPLPGRRPPARSRRSTSSPRHDGFTLRDLVSYNDKHNEANGEDNRDGTDDNRSLELRRRGPDRRPGGQRAARRASSATSSRRCCSRRACRCCSRGDELGRTQQRQQQRLLPGQRDLVGRLGASASARARPARVHAAADRASARSIRSSAGRRSSPARSRAAPAPPDVWWFRPDGRRMTQARLERGATRSRSAPS